MFNKHLVAVGVALLAFGAYLFLLITSSAQLRTEDGLVAAGILVGTLGAVSCLILAIEICRHSAADLGELRDERQALLGGLFFAFAIGIVAIGKVFLEVPSRPPVKQQALWIDGSWGPNSVCGKALKFRLKANDTQLAIETGGEIHHRRLSGPPTHRQVKTEGGSFDLDEGGAMTSTVAGYDGVTFDRCVQ